MIIIGKSIEAIKCIRFVPHLMVRAASKNRAMLDYEMERWLKLNDKPQKGWRGFIELLIAFPEYRSLFYHRTGCKFLRRFAKGQTNLHFNMPSDRIGWGLVIWHGYSTVLNANRLGRDCEVWHNVTLGKKTTLPIDDKPSIGDGVKIATGAIVIGDIVVADGVTIGAGTVVNKSITQPGAVAVGTSFRVISPK